ncbi:hypothetical protein TSAR_007949, partial [Trichomalopsis sarcophagae]
SRGARRLAQGQQGVLPLFAHPEGVTYITWIPSPTNLKTIALKQTHTRANDAIANFSLNTTRRRTR